MSMKGQPMNLTIKSISALLLVGSLSACGGGSVSVEEANAKLSVIKDNAVDVSPFDTNNDNNLSGQELVNLWNSLNEEHKEIIASGFGYTVKEAEERIANLTEEDLATNIGGTYKINSDLNIGAANLAGITGTNVNISVIDNGSHGVKVTDVIEGIAINANTTFHNTNSGEYIVPAKLSEADKTKIKNADIVNMSYGFYADEDEFANAGITNLSSLTQIENFDAGDVTPWGNLLVIAAGNEGENGSCSDLTTCNAEALFQIAFNETVLVVGALNDEGTALESYSNQAGLLQNYFISAPVSNRNGDLSGTSFAAPYVTGTAALIMDKFDNTDAVTTRQIIFDTADDLGAKGVDPVFGHGRLNVGRALSPIGHLN